MKKQKILLVSSLVLTGLYVFWLTPGWWNLGFSIINSLFLTTVGYFGIKKIKKDWFLMTLWLSSLMLGWFLSCRSFEFVRVLTILAILVLNTLISCLIRQIRVKLDFGLVVKTGIKTVLGTIRSYNLLGKLVFNKPIEGDNKWTKVISGVVISIPLLLVFGVLFYSADPIFAKIVNLIKIPEIKLNAKLLWDVLFSLIFFGLSLSMLRAKFVEKIKNSKVLKQITEVNVAVGILEVLLLIFAIIQVKYFWATTEDLRSLGIVFSEYTRQGYGQMILAAILAYGIVMILDYSYRSKKSSFVKGLGLLIIGEIFIFVMAATKRNYLYQSAYGFTEIRLLGFSLSVWITAMLVLIFIKIIKNRKNNYFTRGAILITALSMLGLNGLNIDKTIVEAKPANLDSGIDYKYLTGLSEDTYTKLDYIFVGVETKVNMTSNFSELYENKRAVQNLRSKYDLLRVESKNSWQWGGAWNYSAVQYFKYLDRNQDRLTRMESGLKVANEKISQNQEKQRQEKILAQINLVYDTLVKKYNYLKFYKQTEIHSIAIVTDSKLNANQIDDIRQQLMNITRGNCYFSYSYNTSNVSYSSGNSLYSIECQNYN
jgi:hypothetical protein